jgi:dTDP-4-amino-4,6-dideoxygalactose transaminase
MNKNFLPFSKPDINQAAIDEVVDSLKTGWLASGPKVKIFEQDLRNYLHIKHALVLNSATSGLHLALKCLGLKEGDEVITTPITFVATLNTIEHVGAKPVLVDVDLTTYNIDIEQLKNAITSKTRAILPIHYAGVPVDLDPLYELAKKHNLRVIEDAAHAIGSKYKDKLIGSFGDVQVFSFHPNKVITSGEGGCITTSDDELARLIGIMRFHGIDREAWNRNSKEGSQHYDVIAPGYKYNMLDIQAAIGIHQLRELEIFINKRTALAMRYNEALSEWSELALQKAPNYSYRNSWYLYAPLINKEYAKMTRDEFMIKMKELDIGTGYHYQAVHLFRYYKDKYGFKRGDFPNSERISDGIVSLPLFPAMTFADQDKVIKAMKQIFHRK